MNEKKCVICGSKPTINHHLSYGANRTIPLCNTCHMKVHHDKKHFFYPLDKNTKSWISINLQKTMHTFIKEIIKENPLYKSVNEFCIVAIREKIEKIITVFDNNQNDLNKLEDFIKP